MKNWNCPIGICLQTESPTAWPSERTSVGNIYTHTLFNWAIWINITTYLQKQNHCYSNCKDFSENGHLDENNTKYYTLTPRIGCQYKIKTKKYAINIHGHWNVMHLGIFISNLWVCVTSREQPSANVQTNVIFIIINHSCSWHLIHHLITYSFITSSFIHHFIILYVMLCFDILYYLLFAFYLMLVGFCNIITLVGFVLIRWSLIIETY